jgi:hypothetical protein
VFEVCDTRGPSKRSPVFPASLVDGGESQRVRQSKRLCCDRPTVHPQDGGRAADSISTMAGGDETTTPNTRGPVNPTCMPWYKQLWTIKLTLVVILTPICFLPIPLAFPSAVRLVQDCAWSSLRIYVCHACVDWFVNPPINFPIS